MSDPILIIEDEHALASALAAVARRMQCEPVLCATGARGLDEAAARFLHRRPIQVTEAAAETNQVFDGELLTTKPDNQMIQPCAVNLVELLSG